MCEEPSDIHRHLKAEYKSWYFGGDSREYLSCYTFLALNHPMRLIACSVQIKNFQQLFKVLWLHYNLPVNFKKRH